MNKIKEFFINNKYVFIWTICYFAVVWGVLRVMFGFNIFLGNHWGRLACAHLHGFPAFVFGILLLAAVPLYVATTVIIVRTKKPLLAIPVPKIFSKKSEQVVEEPKPAEVVEQEEPLPDGLPMELRAPFLRARKHITLGAGAQSVFNKIESDVVRPDKDPLPVEPDLPLPSDFDVETDVAEIGDKPLVFSDVDFDEDDTDEEENNIVFDYLQSHGYGNDCVNMGDMVVCQDFAIVWHEDKDLWVADEGDVWFGPGKQELSPVARVKAFSEKAGTQPVLYLASKNILDLDTLSVKWKKDGIIVIGNLKELNKLLKNKH